jgi:Sec-independent protein secretion pathway component TatC
MPVNLMFTSITEAFYVSLELSIVLGFIFTIPFFYCQLYEFIVPGLYEYEADN